MIQVALIVASLGAMTPALAGVGVGAKPIAGAEVILDGTREMLDQKWTYWKGPRFSSSLPIKWQVVEDPVDGGQAISTSDPAAAGGKFGAADIVTKKPYRDFRLHVEFIGARPLIFAVASGVTASYVATPVPSELPPARNRRL